MLPVHPIRISNPFFEGSNTVYVIESNPLTLIDTGVATEFGYERLRAGLTEVGLSVEDIGRVILTHKHIDHIGNAWRIQQLTDAEVLIHEHEVQAITRVEAQGERFATLVNRRFEEWLVPNGQRADSKMMPNWEIQPAECTALRHGDQINVGDEPIQVIHTPGHTMGSICLLYGDHLFSGDHVLEEMSPNVGGGDIRQQGLLRHFLESLKRIQGVTTSPLVMPGHGTPFNDLTERCQQLIEHHQERLDQITTILEGKELSVYELACEVFGELDDFHIFLGCAEANSHLQHLAEDQLVVENDQRFRLAD